MRSHIASIGLLVVALSVLGARFAIAEPPPEPAKPTENGDALSDEALDRLLADPAVRIRLLERLLRREREAAGKDQPPTPSPAPPAPAPSSPGVARYVPATPNRVLDPLDARGASPTPSRAIPGPATGLRVVVPVPTLAPLAGALAPSAVPFAPAAVPLAPSTHEHSPYVRSMPEGAAPGGPQAWAGDAANLRRQVQDPEMARAEIRSALLRTDAERMNDVGRVSRPTLGRGFTPQNTDPFSPFGTGYHFESATGGYYTVEGAGNEGDALNTLANVFTIVPAKAKLGLLMSNQKNRELERMYGSSSDFRHKGFNVPAARLDAAMHLGAVGGEVAVDYYENYQDEGQTVLLQNAFAKISVPGSQPDRIVLMLGEITQNFGIYGGKEWVNGVWPDKPIIFGRLMPDNFNSLGIGAEVHLSDLGRRPWPFDSLLSVCVLNADGDNMTSFMGGAGNFGGYARDDEDETSDFGQFVGGARLTNAISLGGASALQFGGSYAIGPNGIGDDGETHLWGLHGRLLLIHTCRDARGVVHADGGLVAQVEWLERNVFADSHDGFPRAELDDWGFCASLIYDFPARTLGWNDAKLSLGARWERADSSGGDIDPTTKLPIPSSENLLRNERESLSVLVGWTPSGRLILLKNFSFLVEYRHDMIEADQTTDAILVGLQVR